jgi:indole-3-pyruvate monooxygenase
MAEKQQEINTDVLVVGSGPAGLAVAACLRQAGISFVLLEKEQQVAPSWRRHYDRLHLHTDRAHSSLPHLPLPRQYPRYPSRQQVVDYLESYARRFSLDPRFGEEVLSARPRDGGWEVDTNVARYLSQAVVLATGYNAKPVRPQWPGMESYQGVLLHSSEYRSGARFSGQDVLVVGFGNSGGEIAIDLFEQGARASIVVRGTVNLLPRDLLGLPILTWAVALSRLPPRLADFLSAPLLRWKLGNVSRLGLRKSSQGPFAQVTTSGRIPLIDVGTLDLIRRQHIRVRPGIRAFTERGVIFEDGAESSFDAIVLATGYRAELERILDKPDGVIDGAGKPQRSGYESAFPGLYLCGFHVAPTGMLREIALEAHRLTESLSRQLRAPSDSRGHSVLHDR